MTIRAPAPHETRRMASISGSRLIHRFDLNRALDALRDAYDLVLRLRCRRAIRFERDRHEIGYP